MTSVWLRDRTSTSARLCPLLTVGHGAVASASAPLGKIPEEKRLRFPVHAGLERFLAENFPFLFPGLSLVKTEYELPSGNRADMLAKDKTTGDWVVIELKPAVPDRGVVSQIVDYMQEVRSAPPSKRGGHGVRGMVITGEADPVLQEHVQVLAAEEGFQLDWLVYRIEMTLAPPAVASALAQLPAAAGGVGQAVMKASRLTGRR